MKDRKRKVHLADPGIDGWIILKCKGMNVDLPTELIWRRIKIIGELL
jgi:hypothetical protein